MLFGFLVVIFLPTFCESFRLSIIGGQKSNIISFPYQLSMSFNGFFTCGASIISPNFALTAAHCTIYQDAKDMTLRAGSSFRSNFGIEISVTHIIQHPKFSIRTYDFDFSLLKFQTALPFGPRIRPVKLPEEEEWLQPGSKCLVSGFGRTEDGDVPEDLRSTGIEIIEEKRCKLSFAAIGFNVTSHMICAGEENPKKGNDNKDACAGDSGGPLFCEGRLFGVVSAGNGCGLRDFPGLYSEVSSVRSWIRKISGV